MQRDITRKNQRKTESDNVWPSRKGKSLDKNWDFTIRLLRDDKSYDRKKFESLERDNSQSLVEDFTPDQFMEFICQHFLYVKSYLILNNSEKNK